MLYIRYRYTTYTIELTVNRIEARLGGSSLRLVYIYSSRRASLVYTYVILDRYSQGYIRLVYTIGIQLQIYVCLLPTITATARALSTISIYLIYAFSITYLILPSQGQGLGLGLYTLISIYFFQVYIKHMLTIIVAEVARVSSTGHLRINKVYNYKVAYSKRRYSIYKNKIQESSPILVYIALIYRLYSTYSQYIRYGVVEKLQCDRYYYGYATRIYGPYFNNLACLFYTIASRMHILYICILSVILYSLFIKYFKFYIKINLYMRYIYIS